MDTPQFEALGDGGRTFVAVMTYGGRTAAAIVSHIPIDDGAWVYAIRGDVSAGPIQVCYARLADAMADGRRSLWTALGVPDADAAEVTDDVGVWPGAGPDEWRDEQITGTPPMSSTSPVTIIVNVHPRRRLRDIWQAWRL